MKPDAGRRVQHEEPRQDDRERDVEAGAVAAEHRVAGDDRRRRRSTGLDALPRRPRPSKAAGDAEARRRRRRPATASSGRRRRAAGSTRRSCRPRRPTSPSSCGRRGGRRRRRGGAVLSGAQKWLRLPTSEKASVVRWLAGGDRRAGGLRPVRLDDRGGRVVHHHDHRRRPAVRASRSTTSAAAARPSPPPPTSAGADEAEDAGLAERVAGWRAGSRRCGRSRRIGRDDVVDDAGQRIEGVHELRAS